MRKLFLVFSLLIPGINFAQQFSINWYKVAGGGGASAGSVYSINGTIGQPDASAAMTAGNYSLTGGFWALISAVQTSGAPALHISHSGSTITVYWQNVPGWILQQNNTLTAPAGWTVNSNWTTSNGTNYLNIAPTTGNLFFRLERP